MGSRAIAGDAEAGADSLVDRGAGRGTRGASRAAAMWVGVAWGTLLAGGCPATFEVLSVGDPLPGQYYVQEQSGVLSAYRLPDVRGEAVSRYQVAGSASWFIGSGLYELDESGGWSRVSSDEELTLDEVLMLHDPLAAAGP